MNLLFEQEKEFSADFVRQKIGLEMIVSDPAVGELLVAERPDKGVVGMVSLLYTVSTAIGGRVACLYRRA